MTIYVNVLIGLTQLCTRCSDSSCQAQEDLIAGFSAIESVAVAFDFCTCRNPFSEIIVALLLSYISDFCIYFSFSCVKPISTFCFYGRN